MLIREVFIAGAVTESMHQSSATTAHEYEVIRPISRAEAIKLLNNEFK